MGHDVLIKQSVYAPPIIHAILDGESPVKVWREYREMTQQTLAKAANISTSYLSQIESGKRAGKTTVLQAIAQALNITLDDIVVPSES